MTQYMETHRTMDLEREIVRLLQAGLAARQTLAMIAAQDSDPVRLAKQHLSGGPPLTPPGSIAREIWNRARDICARDLEPRRVETDGR